MRALLQIGHDLAAALDAACNARPASLRQIADAAELEAEVTGRMAAIRDRHPLARLPLEERIEAQERADYHAEEMEAEYGPMSRDADFDERFPPDEDEVD